MISKFFIDRPIFATVISIIITLVGFVAMFTLPVAQYPDVTPPTVQVTALYPGANAMTVRDTIAAPIEEQVSGVEGMLYMSSQSTNDGAYNLTVTFKQGMDSDMAQVLVQNRVSLALPVIPLLVQNEGISVKKMSPNTLMIVNLVSPDDRYDSTFLSNYATIYIRDELGRLPGVAGITYLGQRDYSLRVWLDPDRLAALGLGAGDIIAAVASQNVQVVAGQIGQPPVPAGQQFQLTINTLGRLTEPEQFADIIVKSGTTSSAAGNAAGSSVSMTGGSDVFASMMPASSGAGTAASSTGQSGPVPQTTGIVRLRDVVTRNPDGSPRVELGSQQYDQSCTLDGKPSVALSIFALPGSNALQTADGVYTRMQQLKAKFPDGVDYRIVYDTTPFIQESVDEVFHTLRDAVILVAIVVLLFLQDWRAMILPMIDVPVSLIGTFAVMAALGYSLNNLTLFGLVLAIGIVVDDAIVVLENIERQIATGLDARTATIKAMDEITGPVVAITLVLSAVFIPCCFLGGISGQFFRQFAVTIAVSTIISAINALTMTPSRAVLIFKTEEKAAGEAGGDEKGGHEAHQHPGGHELQREALPWWIFGIIGGALTVWLTERFVPGTAVGALLRGEGAGARAAGVPERGFTWTETAIAFLPGMLVGGLIGWFIIRPVNAALGSFFKAFNRLFDRMTAGYAWTVGKVLRVSVLVLFAYAGLLALTYFQFIHAPVGFIPQQDKGYVTLNVQLPDSASLERTERMMARIEKAARETPGVQHTLGVSGKSLILNANSPNLGSLYVLFKPFPERHAAGLSADSISREIEEKCKHVARGAVVSTFGAPPVEGVGATGGFKLMIEDRGNLGMSELQRISDRIVDRGNRTNGLRKMFSSSRASTPWLYLDINRTKCMALGVSLADVFTTLQVYLGSFYVNNYNQFERTWQVNLQADPRFRMQMDDIRRLQVRNQQGQMIRLGTLLDARDTSGPVMVLRYNLYASAAITGDAAPGTSSGEALDLMRRVAESEVPASMGLDWTELAYLQTQAGNVAMYGFGLSVMFVFLVLAAQYESWSLPFAVILVVPLCLLCSVTGIAIAGLDVNLFTQIGFVVLVGLASKNAILIVEFARQKQDEGADRYEATVEAARLRLRPILMTSFAFILGVVPLVIATGAGAEMRRSLGAAVFSGMLGVTAFGVLLTPVFYYVVRSPGSSSRLPEVKAPEQTPAATEPPESNERDANSGPH